MSNLRTDTLFILPSSAFVSIFFFPLFLLRGGFQTTRQTHKFAHAYPLTGDPHSSFSQSRLVTHKRTVPAHFDHTRGNTNVTSTLHTHDVVALPFAVVPFLSMRLGGNIQQLDAHANRFSHTPAKHTYAAKEHNPETLARSRTRFSLLSRSRSRSPDLLRIDIPQQL